MLQVSHLTKIYKTKGGANVKALDDVSLTFPEKGMVFLLGKSGSGKSTLLNVCGGLDAPTSGEIIVKGRSSKAFSQSDFDSYRNTFIGFIFQEYNILNEFTVEDNIALALELQGKSKDKKAIAALLEDVDLVGYAKRKPNTLSGGQKQRIAIARALVKSPEIIMADEPTGALDSATGKQVFDTLKKLSAEKLVIVVSHDRDFAEQYGDRIIELKDGQVISDVTKTQEEKQALSGNVTVIGDTLCVKNGSDLNDADFAQIKRFLKQSAGDAMIATGAKDVKAFKTVSRITDDGQKEVFRDTDENGIESKTYTPAESKFIRSKLPLRHAAKIGISSLKTKPIRLFFTIVLCTISFILFGLFSTLTFYNGEATFKQSFKDSSYSTVRLVKNYRTKHVSYSYGKEEHSYESWTSAKFAPSDVAQYASQFGMETFGAVEYYTSYNVQTSSAYWKNEIRNFASLSPTNALRTKITGSYPINDNEIVLSSYAVDVMMNCKANDAMGNQLTLNAPSEILGKSINVNGETYVVVGILNSGTIPNKFDPIKNGGEYNWNLSMAFESELQDGLHLVAFVTENRLKTIASNNGYYDGYDQDNYRSMVVAMETDEFGNPIFPEYGNATYSKISQCNSISTLQFLNPANSAVDMPNEVVVGAGFFYDFAISRLNAQQNGLNESTNQAYRVYEEWKNNNYDRHSDFWSLISEWENGNNIPDDSDTELYALYQDWTQAYAPCKANDTQNEQINLAQHAINALINGREWIDDPINGGSEVPLTAIRRQELLAQMFTSLRNLNVNYNFAAQLYNNQNSSAFGVANTYTIIGITDLDKTESIHNYRKIYFTDAVADAFWATQKTTLDYYEEVTTAYVRPADAMYSTIFLPYNHTDAHTNAFYEIYKNKDWDANDTKLSLSCGLINDIETVDSLIEILSNVFLWIGIVLAAFAALLLCNFISVSISYKKREIGILRAVGARGFDVFKIFFSESFFITFICLIISLISTLVLCQFLNTQIGAALNASIFNFGFLSLITLLGIAVITSVISTFLPVWNAARKKPVESIRAL